MIIDFHTHIFPPIFRKDLEKYFAGEPAFEWLYRSPKARLAGREDLLAKMDEDGVERSVVFGFPWEDPDHFKRHNDYILETVELHPDRFTGLCCFSPLSPEAPREAERCLRAGLSGVGEIAVYKKGPDPVSFECLEEILKICSAADAPLLLHANEPVGHDYPGKIRMDLGDLYRLLKAHPANRIILAHWGGGILFYSLMKKEVREALRNVWFDTAASPYLYISQIYRLACEVVGVDKILFGSDYPLLSPHRYFQEMEDAGLSPRALTKIKGENAAALLGLS